MDVRKRGREWGKNKNKRRLEEGEKEERINHKNKWNKKEGTNEDNEREERKR